MLLGTAPPETTGSGSLTGQLLIAAPTIGDPRFFHTVILMVRHDKGGALGIVINRPVERALDQEPVKGGRRSGAGVEGSLRVFDGGPVQPQLGFVVHTADYHRPETLAVDGRVAMTAGPADPAAISAIIMAPSKACSRSAMPAGGRGSSRPRSRGATGSPPPRSRT